MTETLIPWAPGAQYTRLVCRLGIPRPDGLDEDLDDLPDLMSQGGTVKLKCDVDRIRYLESDGFYRVLTFDEKDWVFKIRPEDGQLVHMNRQTVGVQILSGRTKGLDPANFTWTATITPNKGKQWQVTIPADAGPIFDLGGASPIVKPSIGSPQLESRIAALEAKLRAIELGGEDPGNPSTPGTPNVVIQDNGDGTSTISSSLVTQVADNGDGTSTMFLTTSATDNGDGTTTFTH